MTSPYTPLITATTTVTTELQSRPNSSHDRTPVTTELQSRRARRSQHGNGTMTKRLGATGCRHVAHENGRVRARHVPDHHQVTFQEGSAGVMPFAAHPPAPFALANSVVPLTSSSN